MTPKARDHGKDIDALNRRVNALEQTSQVAPQPVAAPAPETAALRRLADRVAALEQQPRGKDPTPTLGALERRLKALEGQESRVNELHAELSRLSQGVDKVAALEAEVASLKARA